MDKHVLVVFTNSVEGKDEEFNKWYDGVHLREVLAVPGIVAAQRFRAAAPRPGRAALPHGYLAIYEIEGDAGAALAGLVAARPSMTMSDAMDVTGVVAQAFSPLGPRVTQDDV